MTNPDAAVAEYWRLKPLIKRSPPGWNTPVNVQEWAPNAPRYSWANMGRVDHCGLSMNTLLYNIGMVMDKDFPNCAWTPSAYEWAVSGGGNIRFENIQPGDLLLFRNAGSIYKATHIGMAISHWSGGGVRTGEFNTDTSGQGREYFRTNNGYLVAAGRPKWGAPPRPPVIEQPNYAHQAVAAFA